MKRKIKLEKWHNGGSILHEREVEVLENEIMCNDVILPWESNYNNVRLWCIGNEFGVCGCVWAPRHEAFDALCDLGLSAGLAVSEPESFESDNAREEWEDSICRLGNAGEPHSMDYAWIQPVDLRACGVEFMCKLAEARGAVAENLYQV